MEAIQEESVVILLSDTVQNLLTLIGRLSQCKPLTAEMTDLLEAASQSAAHSAHKLEKLQTRRTQPFLVKG